MRLLEGEMCSMFPSCSSPLWVAAGQHSCLGIYGPMGVRGVKGLLKNQ